MSLRLCDGCERHVRDRETRCPFCDSPLTPVESAPPVMIRTSRALQAVVVAASLAGCREEPKPAAAPEPAPSPVVADTRPATGEPTVVDATKAEEPDTAPPAPSPTPTPTPTHKAVPVPTPTPHPTNLKKPYGAPPADGLLV